MNSQHRALALLLPMLAVAWGAVAARGSSYAAPGPDSSGFVQSAVRNAVLEDTASAEEHAVFRVILESHYKHPAHLPLILSGRVGTAQMRFSTYEERNRERLLQGSDSATFESYVSRVSRTAIVTSRIGIPGVIIQSDSLADALAARGAQAFWDSLAAVFPAKTVTVYSFSRVGFDPGETRALVKSMSHCGRFCGDGGLFYLEKRNGVWTTVRQLFATAY